MATVNATVTGSWQGLVMRATIPSLLINLYHSNQLQFYQPTFIRSRSVFRSPRESETINLESSLLTYDIFNLYQKASTLQTDLTDDIEIINNGSSTTYITLISSAEVSSVITISDLEGIVSRLKGYSDRLEILEKGLV